MLLFILVLCCQLISKDARTRIIMMTLYFLSRDELDSIRLGRDVGCVKLYTSAPSSSNTASLPVSARWEHQHCCRSLERMVWRLTTGFTFSDGAWQSIWSFVEIMSKRLVRWNILCNEMYIIALLRAPILLQTFDYHTWNPPYFSGELRNSFWGSTDVRRKATTK